MTMLIANIARETAPGVFHANSWGINISQKILSELISHAKLNQNKKARLCLHPTPNELLQVTYLAFCHPYRDQIHFHPHRVEVLVPILGRAKYVTYDQDGQILESKILKESEPFTISTSSGIRHAIEVLSESFVVLEIGTGPFTHDSTVYR